MKNCNRITEIVSAGEERPLVFKEKVQLRSHLFFCPGCRAFQDNVQTLSRMMKTMKEKED